MLVFIAVIALASAASVSVILNDVRGDFNYNFTNVSPAQVLAKIDYECSMNLAGPANMHCQQIASDNLPLIYNLLRAGKGAYYICQQLQLC
ncbi:unnamed protein product [Nippostrongylus brasiliensis]|uniref:Secreted protein n=2 Tax=Nippostrongylus brasiliensis TaxID=27835 RepID=A0A0N4YWA7_NIPBR|nr:unnamed protein product [Nippostrongylus brasiliensis]